MEFSVGNYYMRAIRPQLFHPASIETFNLLIKLSSLIQLLFMLYIIFISPTSSYEKKWFSSIHPIIYTHHLFKSIQLLFRRQLFSSIQLLFTQEHFLHTSHFHLHQNYFNQWTFKLISIAACHNLGRYSRL